MSLSRSMFPSSRFDKDWWDSFNSAGFNSRISDQYFGVGLQETDFTTPTLYHGYYIRPRRQQVIRKHGTGFSEVNQDEKKFLISLDVSQFEPGEIEVKTVDNFVVIHAKHSERADDHGFITREFTRRYMIPKDVEPTTVTSSLSTDGFLTIEAPKIRALEMPKNERMVPITVTERRKERDDSGESKKLTEK